MTSVLCMIIISNIFLDYSFKHPTIQNRLKVTITVPLLITTIQPFCWKKYEKTIENILRTV